MSEPTADQEGGVATQEPSATAAVETDSAAAAELAAVVADDPSGGTAGESLRRVLRLPVTVVVHLAEKKIGMGQLLTISPGALITFNKPCEDLLDLYVNNRRYCRGEAVKIGEKFGLKISEVGVVEVRESPILE